MKFFVTSFCTTLLILLLAFPSYGQNKDSTATVTPIDKKFVVSDIYVEGNYRTKPSIILRELTFHKGDTIHANNWKAEATRSEENLRNTSLFHRATVDTVHMSDGHTAVSIIVEEKWYIWPTPIFQVEERNFNVWWDQDNRSLQKIDYGLTIADNNALGLRQVFKVTVQLGYTHQYGISYTIPYLNKNQNGGLQFSFAYDDNRDIAYTSVGGILTFLNTPLTILRQEYNSRIDYTYRQGLYNVHYLELNFHSCKIDDTILKITQDYLPFNQTSSTFFGAKYFFRRDLRDYAPYPLSGYYMDFSINDYGLDIMQHPFNILYVQTSFHKYWNLSNNFFFASMVEGKISNNTPQPYYLQRGLGYSNDFVRGYEDYVIDGNDFALVKNEIKFRFLNVPVQPLPLFNIRQFDKAYYALYLTLFSDWGYVSGADPYVVNNFLTNKTLLGNGIGIDLVAYYDLIWRFEYSFNALGQSGFFLHFQAGM